MRLPDLTQSLSDLDHKGRTDFWVNFYAKTRYYGGPEGGGWWVDEEELVNAIHLGSGSPTSVQRIIDRHVGKYRKVEWGKLDSVIGGCELHVRIELEAGSGWLAECEDCEYQKPKGETTCL